MRPLPQANSPENPRQTIDYRKCSAPSAPHLQRLALLAPGLSESELRVLLELVVRCLPSSHLSCKASLSALAASTRCSRKSVVRALAALIDRGLVMQHAGSPASPSTFRVLIFDAVAFPSEGGVTMTPPTPEGGVTMTPPPEAQTPENTTLIGVAPDVPFDSIENDSMESASIDTLDPLSPEQENTLRRVFAAKPRDFPTQLIRTAALQLGHLRRKLGRDPSDQWAPNPDPSICAQFLAISKWPILADFIGLVLCDRISPGRTNAWWITVAIEKIHGITPDQQRAFRLKNRPRPQIARTPTPPAPEKTPPGQSDVDAQDLVNHLAQAKTMNRR